MSKKLIIATSIAALFIVLGPLFINNALNEIKRKEINPEFAQYISAFSGGNVSTSSPVRIRFATEMFDTLSGIQEIQEKLFSFEPSVSGKTYWVDNKTIEFRPNEKLDQNTVYNVSFKLDKVMEVPNEFKNFDFQFKTIQQSVELRTKGIRFYTNQNNKWLFIEGTLATADVAENDKIEEIISASLKSKVLKIKWEHYSENKTHRFTIDSIARTDAASQVLLSWSGKSIASTQAGNEEIEIPSINEFKVMSANVENENEQYVSVIFSDPLTENQDLSGLVTLGNIPELKFTIDVNELKIYPIAKQTGQFQLNIDEAVRNFNSEKLGKAFSTSITFDEIKPSVQFIGKGSILPDTKGMVLPIEAVNLKAIDVKIIKIFENNVLQFLQVNNLDGEREIVRVGKKIFQQKVPLNLVNKFNYGKWNRFTLDLEKLIKTEQGAIYRVEISYKKEYSTYKCDDVKADNSMDEMQEISVMEDDDSQGSYDYYGYYEGDYYYEDYNWEERDNPCNNSYYSSSKKISRNILASNLALTAKSGNDGSWSFFAADIKTAQPISGATVELYTYQNQFISSSPTNGDGYASIITKKRPYVAILKQGAQRTYLKLDDGSSLTTSAFDVAGEQIQKGLKGFIYGERGVWRPGDSLYISFILEDKKEVLPKKHPVTFELYTPQGQLYKKIIKTTSVEGLFAFYTKTDESAPTGNWTAKVKVGGAQFSKNIKIETIQPNRLKINLDFGADKISAGNSSLKANLTSTWLHGAPGRNLKADVAVSLSKNKTVFKNYKDYIFDDASSWTAPEQQFVYTGTLDENGTTSFESNISTVKAPGMLNAHFTTRVFEKGGNFSIDRFTLPLSPYTNYVGIKAPQSKSFGNVLQTDTNNTFVIATVNEFGNPVSINNLKVKIFKLEWRWWWEENNGNGEYINDEYLNKISELTVSSKNGKASFNFRIDYPEWGRYLIKVYDEEGGHATSTKVFLDWPGYYSRESRDNSTSASLLSFSSDKDAYKVGETANITIPSSEMGKILISIENGSRVIKSFWTDSKAGHTNVPIEITEEMSPNVFVFASLIQKHELRGTSAPIRMYGYIPLKVEDPATHLKPVITMPEVLRPESKTSITVKEKDGKAMAYTLAIVDEGLLDLTRFKTPDPWSNFYAKEALGVKTWDMYDQVIGAFSGDLERIITIGGDGENGKSGDGAKANRFKPMVKFIGPFFLEKGKSQTHTIDIPNYVGSVRTMVVAGYKGVYGSEEKTCAVKKPLMVLATLPRVVGPEEEVDLAVNVFAMEKKVKNVSVSISTNEYFTLLEGNQKNVSFTQIGDELVNFKLKAKAKLGIAKVKITATSGSEKATYEIEMDVRASNPKITDVIETVAEANQNVNLNYTPIGMVGTNKVTLEVSNIPAINLGKRLSYLISYPHGCIEQTTSSVFPQLYLADITETTDAVKKKTEENIKAGIQRLKKFQTADGGMAYWPGLSDADEWGTNYALHFLLEAQAKGYSIPQGLLENLMKFQKNRAQNWSKKNMYFNDDLLQAYRLYTLALGKKPELGAMNKLKENTKLNANAAWRLAAAYSLVGRQDAAKTIIKNLPSTISPYSEMSFTYGTSERDEAMILETLTLLKENQKALSVLKAVASYLSNSSHYMSTQTTAYALLAVGKYVKENTSGKELRFNYTLNGKTTKVSTRLPVTSIDLDAKSLSSKNLSLKNESGGVLFVRVINEGVPLAGNDTDAANDIQLQVNYVDADGNAIDTDELLQGTDFYAIATVTHPGLRSEYKNLSLTELFPAGWEIHNTRMDENETVNTKITYQDYRDDRVYSYFDLYPRETKTIKIKLTAAYTGKYYLPAIAVEAMYDNSVSARKAGKWISVVSERVVN